jgi:hypothetical protein
MIEEVGIRWIIRLCVAARIDRNIWLKTIKSVEEECILVHHTLGSRRIPVILELIGRYGDILKDFMNIISTYDTELRRHFPMNVQEIYIYEKICSNMLKSILFSCMSKCSISVANSDIAQGLLIKLLYVIPKIKTLILPLSDRLTNMPILSERIQLLTRLEEFEFHYGCTSEIIIQLSTYCPLMKRICVEYSTRVNDSCVEHLLKLRSLISLNIAGTLTSTNGYATLLSGLPQLEDITCFYPFDHVISDLPVSLPSVRKFTGIISAGRSLVRKCPNITELILISMVNDPSDLAEFTMVADLTIKNRIAVFCMLSPLITRLGPTLTSLKLFNVVSINMEDVIHYCSSLKHLSITQCKLNCELVLFSRELKHFQNVVHMRLLQNKGNFCYISNLHLYVNLNILHIAGIKEVTDASIARIIKIGGLRNLNEFVAEYCGDLSLKTAILLLDSCPSLVLIGHLKGWPRISRENQENFLDFVKTHNLSLVVS